MGALTQLIGDNDNYGQKLSDLTGYNLIGMNLMAVPENYLGIVNDDYYYPTSF
jgi:hypothetical protein